MTTELAFTGSAQLKADAASVPASRLGQLAEPGREAEAVGWRATWRDLSFCWRDPDASPDIAAAYVVRQFHSLREQAPLASFNCCVFSLILAWLFWSEDDRKLILGWIAAVWGISALFIVIWHVCRQLNDSLSCKRVARVHVASITVLALLFSVMPTYLFGVADLVGKLLIIAIIAAFIAHGALQCARWPLAGITWGAVMCIGVSSAMVYFYGGEYVALVYVAASYCAIIVASVLITSRLFVTSLMAETEIDRQKQLIGLLLNDFEAEASDWLWETDADGRIRHASRRLADALGYDTDRLHGQMMTTALFGADSPADEGGRHAIHYLGHCFRRSTTFRDIEVPLGQGDALRWWSLSGKPLFADDGRVSGWRGVGSDITAERGRQQAERDLQASREAAARFAGELDTARRIQMGLLPDLAGLVAGESRFSVAAILEPAYEVGGDYYEFFPLDERRFCLAVADVSGKGVPASLFMAMTKTLAAALVGRSADLGEAVREVANELDRKNPEMLFVTSFIAILDAESGELTCVSGGHDAPALLRDGQLCRLDLGEALGPPLCGVPDFPFQSIKHRLQPGDTLCLFTDGVTEASNGQGFYGTERLARALLEHPCDASVEACAHALRNSVRAFEAGYPPADDLTIMVLRWLGAEPASVEG